MTSARKTPVWQVAALFVVALAVRLALAQLEGFGRVCPLARRSPHRYKPGWQPSEQRS
jgi:hypothetical protein